MTTMTISGSGASVCVTVLGYERERADNSSDANWLDCYIEITAPPFSGSYEASLATSDFARFENQLKDLSEVSEGEAVFESDEEALEVRIFKAPRGLVTVKGRAFVSTTKSTLAFEFNVDQTYLNEFRRSSSVVLEKYPVRAVGDE